MGTRLEVPNLCTIQIRANLTHVQISIIETCVMSILLFSSEDWIVSGGILENFLEELAMRAMKWPRHFSNTVAMTVLDLDSVTSRIVVWKLGFLKRQLAVGAVGVAAVAMRPLLDDPNSLLVEHFGTNYNDAILEGGDECMR